MMTFAKFLSGILLVFLVVNVSKVSATEPPLIIKIEVGAFCEEPRIEGPAYELAAVADQLFARAETIAQKSDQCTPSCASGINQAEYCELSAALNYERSSLERLSSALGKSQALFARAADNDRLALQILADDLALFGNEALNQLQSGLTALNQDSILPMTEISWMLSARELGEFSDMLSALSDLELASPATLTLAARLQSTSADMARLGDEIILAMTRAKLMKPATQNALQSQVNTIIEEVRWTISSIKASAAAEVKSAKTTINTNANAVPEISRSLDYAKASVCLHDLAVSSAVASEASVMAKDLFGSCRAFDSCGSSQSPPAKLVHISDILALENQMDKQVFATTALMCTR